MPLFRALMTSASLAASAIAMTAGGSGAPFEDRGNLLQIGQAVATAADNNVGKLLFECRSQCIAAGDVFEGEGMAGVSELGDKRFGIGTAFLHDEQA